MNITLDLHGCARCDGEGHDNITFVPFTQKVDEKYTHWAMCPTLNEPILLTVNFKEQAV